MTEQTPEQIAATDRERALVEAARPFARAEHIVASVEPDGRIRMILTYPMEATETFALGDLRALSAALSQYEEPKP